jgi:aspartyl-tRNA synthetase
VKEENSLNDSFVYYLADRWDRTNYCGELGREHCGNDVFIAGWIKKVRELGGLTFVDLGDRTGIVQLVLESDSGDLWDIVHSLSAEDVIACRGNVRRRPDNMVNQDMKTGEVEVVLEKVYVLNRSKVPPFNVRDQVKASDDLRLKYRYLDLRRIPLQRNLELRHNLSMSVRNYLSGKGFIEVETPMLVKGTPEGARDYIVPSRLRPGTFYALPQSPQLYKQILMVSGVDKYFQIARCLRDEDLRADRQPEHTQIDIEMSFVGEEDVFSLTEGLIGNVLHETIGVDVKTPFQRMTYNQVMDNYGTDKPDLRFDLRIEDCSDCFRSSGFKVFTSILEGGGTIRGISFREGYDFSRSRIKNLESIVKDSGGGGLVTIKSDGEKILSPISKYLDDRSIKQLNAKFNVKGNTIILLVAGKRDVVLNILGELREFLGGKYLLGDKKEYKFLWVNRFPLFLPSEAGGWEPAHHIFSMPLSDDIPILDKDPGKVKGYLYDLVCNGTELGSGSIRIHNRELQEKLFRIIGIEKEETERKFGFLLKSFEFGAPPHGGIALGLDRMAMILGGGDSIRDYIAFPKTQSATSLMEGAPSEIDESVLKELRINVLPKQEM